MTARLDVTPKTTEHNRIVCTSKSEAEVTNNKKLRSRYCTIDATKLTTDRHEAPCGLFATAELLVLTEMTTASRENNKSHAVKWFDQRNTQNEHHEFRLQTL